MNSSLFLTTYLVGLLTNAEILRAGMCYLSLSQISKSKLSGTTDAFFFIGMLSKPLDCLSIIHI